MPVPGPGGLEGIIETYPGGKGNNIEVCPNRSLSRGALTSLSLGGGGGEYM